MQKKVAHPQEWPWQKAAQSISLPPSACLPPLMHSGAISRYAMYRPLGTGVHLLQKTRPPSSSADDKAHVVLFPLTRWRLSNQSAIHSTLWNTVAVCWQNISLTLRFSDFRLGISHKICYDPAIKPLVRLTQILTLVLLLHQLRRRWFSLAI